ncbi:hypothetical protein ACFVAV_30460 [Nocardia sp. NPDC057663]|uniref:hypothetical protein n=1 Tax=Nocardia sp. NPDC057663 TaxID=3346201 RepID=UPI00366B55FC
MELTSRPMQPFLWWSADLKAKPGVPTRTGMSADCPLGHIEYRRVGMIDAVTRGTSSSLLLIVKGEHYE